MAWGSKSRWGWAALAALAATQGWAQARIPDGYAGAREVHAGIAMALGAAAPGSVAAGFEVGTAADWPVETESFAYEQTGLDGSARVVALDSWVAGAGADELAFVIGHEMAHAACQHRFKVLGLYAARSQAVGAGLDLLAMAAESDTGFAFSIQGASRAMELEADGVGAALAQAAGYDALRGARSAVGGESGPGSHPSGADRLLAVRAALTAPPGLAGLVRMCQMREPQAY